MANEGKISISTEMDLSGILNGADKINEILDEWKVNAETVSGSFRQLANSGGDFEMLAGSIAGVVSTIKLAAEAQKTWETAMAVFQSSTGFGLAVTAIGAAVGVLNVMMEKAKEPSENLAKSLGIMGEKAESFVSGMSTAGNYLDNFNNTLFASSEKQQELKDNMQEIQNGITEICRTASDERRGLTEKEIEALDTYFTRLSELNQSQADAEQNLMSEIERQATTMAQNHNVSAEEYAVTAQKWIGTAQNQYDKQVELAEEHAQTEIALLNQQYKDKATLDNQAYKSEYDVILNHRDAKVREAKKSMGKITAAYTEGYSEQTGLQDVFTHQWSNTHLSLEGEAKRHATEIGNINKNTLIPQNEKGQALIAENQKYQTNLNMIWTAMTKDMTSAQKEQLGVFIALAANADMYGGEVNDSTKTMVDVMGDSFGSLKGDVKEKAGNFLQPMMDTMISMEPILVARSKRMAGGILNAWSTTFEEQSPSKASRRIFKNLMKGAELGMEDETDKLYRQTDDMANGVLDSAQEAMDIHSPSRVTRDELGKPIVEGIAVGIAEGGDEVNEALQKVMDELDLQRDLGLTSDEEYYAQMERYRDEYLAKGTKDWWDYTKQIMKFKADSFVEAFDKQEETDQKAQERMERRGELTHQKEMGLLAGRAQRYRDMAREVLALEGLTQEERLDLYEKYAEKAEDLDDEMADKVRENQKKLSDAARERFEQDLSRGETLFAFRKKMNNASFEEEQGYLKARGNKYRAFAEEALRLEGYTQEEKLELQKGYLEKAEELERQHMENQKDRLDSVAGKIKSNMKLYTKSTFKEGFAEPNYQMENGVYADQNAKLSNGVINLPDYKAQTEQLDRYSNAIQALKDRLAETGATLSEDFYTEVYSMDTGDATLFLQKLASQSDQAFEEFAAYENKRSETANSRAAQILGIDLDSFKQAVSDMLARPAAENPDALSPESLGINQGQTEEQYAALGDHMKASLLEHFERVPEGFLDIGGDAAQQFADGFVQKLEAIKLQIQSAVADIMPPAAAAAGANASYQYVTNYNFAASAHEPLSRQIQTARDADTVNRLRGIG